ncbi:hypothetical protein OU995_07660 [Roseateles sp. SL47]|uniref:hypothetical protein n=1 Tax=Roseateles sp. SL47 TaxID=2995138 RepID=UPI00226E677C|nr:hypothetical protein [Roseateles sp. SL47]WAC74572.1 hypothetical protein OU995_07660 [Roseateles sp. SL47]
METPPLTDFPTYSFTSGPAPQPGAFPEHRQALNIPSVPSLGGSQMPDFPSFSSSHDDTSVVSSENASVVRDRTDATLTLPTTENAEHKDLEIQMGDKTVKLRWHEKLGYVMVGEKTGSGEMHMYTEAEFREANKGQLEQSGGGRIPPATSQKPEYFVPPEGSQSLIYRYDPESGKDVIVGYRVNGERHYFQSRATMEAVNAKATEGGLATPTRPPTAPDDSIPSASQFNEGYVNQFAFATNNDGKTYIWRWDESAGRYCAVGESQPEEGHFYWYNTSEYQTKNSGPNALVMSGSPMRAPVADPAHPEAVETGNTEIRFVQDDKAGEYGNGAEKWGKPIYIIDRDTGHKVYIGVQVTKDGKTSEYYFDNVHMNLYNDTETINGKTYFKAKDLSTVDDKYTRENEGQH